MWHLLVHQRQSERRRGVVAVYVVVVVGVLLGFAALTIDVGVMYNTKADLQDAADAAAMAAASAYATDAMTRVRTDPNDYEATAEVSSLATGRAHEISRWNPSWATTTTLIEPGDITLGWLDLDSATSPIEPGRPASEYNAVRVVVRRTEGGANGPVDLLFAAIFGRHIAEITASATAVYDDRTAAVNSARSPDILPFTIHEDLYDAYLQAGEDQFTYNEEGDFVTTGPDGLTEVNLYPHRTTPGNFGLLNIGTPNQGATAVEWQIANGVPPTDFAAEVGSEVITFVDEVGDPTTYDMTGDPGLAASLESAISSRQGDLVGFFVHSTAILNGSNTIYTITELHYGYLMDVRLSGGPSRTGLWIQPISFTGDGVIISPIAPSTDGSLARIMLAR
jgi:hypothetical protein